MLRRVKVFCGVLVFRAVAAADVAAFKTFAQMHPRIVHFEAFFATVWRARLDVADVIQM
jgi:hypothetical protein